MALYLIGDVQGCDQALGHLLDKVDFSPSRDHLIVLGDLVNRGPDSLAVLRRLRALDGSARALLGNHDLHLLSVWQGVRAQQASDTLDAVLQAPDAGPLLNGLRHLPLALHEQGILMVHAGVLPQWTTAQALSLAAEVQAALQADDWHVFLRHMYGNAPAQWHAGLVGFARLRVVVNALTRLRFCDAQGRMDFKTKTASVDDAPAGYMPWFDVPGRRTADQTIAFGHWSTLGGLMRPRLLGLDTGCVWGGSLSAVRVAADGRREWLEQPCPQAQKPGRA